MKEELEKLLGRELTHLERIQIDWLSTWDKETTQVIFNLFMMVYGAGIAVGGREHE